MNQKPGINKKDVLLGFSVIVLIYIIEFIAFYKYYPREIVGDGLGGLALSGLVAVFYYLVIIGISDIIAIIVGLALISKRGWGFFIGIFSVVVVTVLFVFYEFFSLGLAIG